MKHLYFIEENALKLSLKREKLLIAAVEALKEIGIFGEIADILEHNDRFLEVFNEHDNRIEKYEVR